MRVSCTMGAPTGPQPFGAPASPPSDEPDIPPSCAAPLAPGVPPSPDAPPSPGAPAAPDAASGRAKCDGFEPQAHVKTSTNAPPILCSHIWTYPSERLPATAAQFGTSYTMKAAADIGIASGRSS